MAAVPSERQKFTSSVLRFLITYGFDGLHFDWEFPGTRGGDPNIDKVLNQIKEGLNLKYILKTG